MSMGSAFNTFEKLQGAKNYTDWCVNMETMLLSLQQWGLVDGSVKRPQPANADNITSDKIKEIAAYNLHVISAYQEIRYQIGDAAKNVVGMSRDPKDIWDTLERRYGLQQEGLQAALVAKLQQAVWTGEGSILAHCDYMFDLRFQLCDTGLALSNQSFHCYFTQSLPPSLDILVMFYNDKTYDVKLLCEHFTRWEARKELHGDKFNKIGNKMGLENSMAMFGQHSSGKKKESKKCDLKDVICYGCGSKGHLSRNCLTLKDNKGKDDKGKDKQKDGKQKDAGKGESSNTTKPLSGSVFTTLVNSSIAGLPLTNAFYIDLGVSAHFIPLKTNLHGYVKFGKLLEIAAANNGKIQAYGLGTLRVMTSVEGINREVDLEDVYYVPGVHVHLLSLGKLAGQGWEVCIMDGGMELKDRSGELFAVVKKTNNIYPVELTVLTPSHGLAAWMGEEACMEPTYQDIVQ
jgi:hypothetical protein